MSSINKLFLPYPESLELKELGFDEPCFGSWETEYVKVPTYTHSISQFYKNSNHPVGKVTIPTFSQAFKFFREKHSMDQTIITNYSKEARTYRVGIIYVKNGFVESLFLRLENNSSSFIEFKSYEEAELACLQKLIKLCKGIN